MYSQFETLIKVRPDDIDLNNHLHSTKYLDYMLAARFEQMEVNYGMSMPEFFKRGLNWVANNFTVDFKRSLKLGDTAIVRTGIREVGGAFVIVQFSVLNKATGKVAAEGHAKFTLIDLHTGKPARIPEDILTKYII
ncbi:MAG: acyl-CoA thioesterase [Ignavibacteriales bacterium]|nr:acyl-CoA thioesterase [Ignavibacteriales bacterium]